MKPRETKVSASFAIEKSIPVPQKREYQRITWPFKGMAVGDSFFVPAKGDNEIQHTFRKLLSSCSHRTERKGERYTAKHFANGVRVWLVSKGSKFAQQYNNMKNKNHHEIKIEKGIPIPEDRRGRRSAYPFNSMKPGESFFVAATKDVSLERLASRLNSSCNQRYHRYGQRYAIRKVDGGVRVWFVGKVEDKA